MAWRLGSLSNKVDGIGDDVAELKQNEHDRAVDISNIRSDVAALRGQVRDVGGQVQSVGGQVRDVQNKVS